MLSVAKRDEIRARLKDGIEEDLKHAFEEPEPVPVTTVEVGDVYANGCDSASSVDPAGRPLRNRRTTPA